MNSIYSPEPLDDLMVDNTGDNGDVISTLSVNRNNRGSSIYLELAGHGKVIPTIYRGYISDNGTLTYRRKIYEPFTIPHTTEQIIFDYDEHEDFNYVNYFIDFECVYDGTTLDLFQMGVIYDKFEVTQNGVKAYNVTLVSDINNKPLSKQRYVNTQSFSMLCNATDMEEILNVVEKPYYFVNVINSCLDNSSKLLAENGISRSYVTTATKMIELTIQNIVGK